MACIAPIDRTKGDRDRTSGASGPFAADRSARAAQKLAALGEMTEGITHDFRNILAVIESGLRLAERSTNEPERLRVGIAAARDGIDRGARLTAQLLAFAKQQELGVQAGNVNELLMRIRQFLKHGAGPGTHIVYDLAPEIPKCSVDPSQFGTALLNLVLNARDAMPQGGEITIRTERFTAEAAGSGPATPPAYVRVRVEDNGQGMTADLVRRIFEPFFTTKGESGTGLGLPQVAAFMRRMGGDIRISSEPRVGTTVDLLFPAFEPDRLSAG